MSNKRYILPLVPMRGITIFPGMIVHFDAARKVSTDAIEKAVKNDGMVFLALQKDILVENPVKEDLFMTGVIAEVKQVLRTPGGALRVLVEGISRAKCTKFTADSDGFTASCIVKKEIPPEDETEEQIMVRKIQRLMEEYASHFDDLSPEYAAAIGSIEDSGEVADITAANFPLKPQDRQKILEELDVMTRLEKLSAMMEHENQILEIEQDVADKLKTNLDKNQRDYVLREQIKVLREELGEYDDSEEASKFSKQIAERNLPEEVKKKLNEELDRLSKLPPHSQEYSVQESYIDTVLALPWDKKDDDSISITKARQILAKEHYGLEKVKEKILELLAVKRLTGEVSGSILCLVGPPGTGKTSIAHSLAESMGRKYVRVSLGGVQNEAEIRGHRKTYVGSMPGRIINAVKQAGTNNPLILLDEIDKMASDLRGDPASAMLEVLDPEQNKTFRDHFIELPFDLSDVLFIATANSVENIPRPLYDRMEVVEVSGYSDEEKLIIAKKYLLPKQRKLAGLSNKELKLPESVLKVIIEGYTRESGVRALERCIRTICRKAAMEITETGAESVSVSLKNLKKFLGARTFVYDTVASDDMTGVATGLAWTETGGDTLFIEVNAMEGTGKLELTGNLGDVMKESAKTATSYIRANAKEYGIEPDFYKTKDIHIHVPEGAIPKDGPSAGITMATAIISALSGKPVLRGVAMTGEITLRGRVLAIGGLREKTLAAYRMGIKTIVIPFENKKDYDELPAKIRDEIKFVFAKDIHEVLKVALRG